MAPVAQAFAAFEKVLEGPLGQDLDKPCSLRRMGLRGGERRDEVDVAGADRIVAPAAARRVRDVHDLDPRPEPREPFGRVLADGEGVGDVVDDADPLVARHEGRHQLRIREQPGRPVFEPYADAGGARDVENADEGRLEGNPSAAR